MTPIFKNIEVSRDDIGDHVKTYAEERNVMNQPRKCLVGSMFGEKNYDHFTFAKMVYKTRNTSDQDLPSCRIYSSPMFPKTRRTDKRCPPCRRRRSKTILAETNKLTGNSMYGTTATNKEKHRKVAFCNENNVSRCINDPFCRQCNPLNK